MNTAGDQQNLDSRMEERRRELGITWVEVMRRAGGVSRQALLEIRKGTAEPRSDTRRRLERALELAPGAFEQMQRGEKPTPATAETPPPVAKDRSEDLAPLEEVLTATSTQLAKLAQLYAWYEGRRRGDGKVRPDDEDRFLFWAVELRRQHANRRGIEPGDSGQRDVS